MSTEEVREGARCECGETRERKTGMGWACVECGTLAAQPKLGRAEIEMILKGLSLGEGLYENWRFLLHDKGDGYLLQLSYYEADVDNPLGGPPVEQKTRKWYISPYSTKTEIVRTAYKMVMTSLEHRLGEHFTFGGRRVYNPHFSVDGLSELDTWKIIDVRKG